MSETLAGPPRPEHEQPPMDADKRKLRVGLKDGGHGGKPEDQRENVSNLEADKRARPLNATDAEYDMSSVCLGQGTFATVFAARRRSDGHRVACKSWRQIGHDFLTPASWKHGLLDGSGTSVPTRNGFKRRGPADRLQGFSSATWSRQRGCTGTTNFFVDLLPEP